MTVNELVNLLHTEGLPSLRVCVRNNKTKKLEDISVLEVNSDQTKEDGEPEYILVIETK